MSQESDKAEIVFDSNEDDTPLTAEQVAMLEEEWPINILHDRQTIQWISRECLIPAYKIMKWDTQRRAELKDPLESNEGAGETQEQPQLLQDDTPLTEEETARLEQRWPILTTYGQAWIEWFSKETSIPVHKIIKWDADRRTCGGLNTNVEEICGVLTERKTFNENCNNIRINKTRHHDSGDDAQSCKRIRTSSQDKDQQT